MKGAFLIKLTLFEKKGNFYFRWQSEQLNQLSKLEFDRFRNEVNFRKKSKLKPRKIKIENGKYLKVFSGRKTQKELTSELGKLFI